MLPASGCRPWLSSWWRCPWGRSGCPFEGQKSTLTWTEIHVDLDRNPLDPFRWTEIHLGLTGAVRADQGAGAGGPSAPVLDSGRGVWCSHAAAALPHGCCCCGPLAAAACACRSSVRPPCARHEPAPGGATRRWRGACWEQPVQLGGVRAQLLLHTAAAWPRMHTAVACARHRFHANPLEYAVLCGPSGLPCLQVEIGRWIHNTKNGKNDEWKRTRWRQQPEAGPRRAASWVEYVWKKVGRKTWLQSSAQPSSTLSNPACGPPRASRFCLTRSDPTQAARDDCMGGLGPSRGRRRRCPLPSRHLTRCPSLPTRHLTLAPRAVRCSSLSEGRVPPGCRWVGHRQQGDGGGAFWSVAAGRQWGRGRAKRHNTASAPCSH